MLHLRLGRGGGEVEDEDVEDVGELRVLARFEVRRLHVLGPAVGVAKGEVDAVQLPRAHLDQHALDHACGGEEGGWGEG